MSLSLPTPMKVVKPARSVRMLVVISDMATLPDCDRMPSAPLYTPGQPTRLRPVWPSKMPLVLGPTRRTPWRRAASTVLASNSAPSALASPKPPASTTAPFTPFSPQASMTSGVVRAGVQTRARSTSNGTEARSG
jgi:hypothetical protein